MAIEIRSVKQVEGSVYSVTVKDTEDQVGIDDAGAAIYRTYTLRHNTSLGAAVLKADVEQLIADRKALVSVEDQVKTSLAEEVSTIDASAIAATKEVS